MTLRLGWINGIAAVIFLGILHPVALAELPSVKLQTSSLVTPTAAWSYFGTASTHTTGVAATGTTAPEIIELANALSQGGTSGSCIQACYARMVYQYVRNNIAMEFRFGLGKGGRGALIDQSGTPFDQAQLMIALLRLGRVAASYQVGTLTLNGAQFQQWTGMTNAPGACQFLADGGIPATVNGATSCSALTAGSTVSSVVMGHIWVVALGNLYDPSYKIQVVKSGIGSSTLASALGCATTSCASGVLSHVPAPVASPIKKVNQIQNVDQTGLEAQLTAYATNLENYIKQQNANNYATNNPNMQVEDLIGGVTIDISQPIPNGSTISPIPNSAYSPNASYLWSGDVPDQFRTTLTVQFGPSGTLSINQLLYADETAANRLRLVNSTGPGAKSDLYSEYMLLAAGPLPSVSTATIPLTLNVTHPYATSGYLAESLTYNVNAYGVVGGTAYTNQVTIIQGWGNASESTVAHFSALVQRDQTHTPVETLSAQNPTLTSSNQLWLIPAPQDSCQQYTPPTTPTNTPNCFELHQATYAANWLAQSARAVALAAAVNGTIAQLHHSVGIVVSGNVPAPAPSGNVAAPTLVISVQTSMSININTSAGAASDRTAAFFGATATLGRLEGSVVEQAGDSWEGGSSLSMMVKSAAASTSTHSSIPIYDVTPQNVAWTVGNSNLSSYGNFYTTEIKPYVDAGGEVILPQQATAGSFCINSVCYSPGFNGFVSYGANADRITYGTDADGFDKGAGGESNPTGIITQQTTIQDYSTKKRTFLSVDPSNGSVTLTPPPDLVTGSGAFPLSLAFQRVYSSAAIGYACGSPTQQYGPCLRTSAEISGLPIGWTHTFAITARLTNDGFASFGRNSALDASSVIAALFTARQLNTGTRTFQSNVATIFTINWLGEKLTANVVAIKKPPDSAAFVRLPDGSFNPPPGRAETLTQTGTQLFRPAGPSLAYWDNSQLSFTLRTKDAQTLTFQYGSALTNGPAPAPYIPALYHATTWTFPTGISLSFTYDSISNGLENAGCLASVSNNIGRSLSFTDMCPLNQNVDPPPDPSTVLKVQDDAGRVVAISFLPSTLTGSNTCGGTCIPQMVSDGIGVTGMLVVAPDQSATTEYDYVPFQSVPVNRDYYRVYQWLTPGDRINPYETVTFDSLYRAHSVKDNTSSSCCAMTYWLTGLYGTENQKVENVIDPLGADTTKYFDRWSSLLQEVNPLGEATSYIYDTARRRIQLTLPELNGFTYTYDVRSNLLSTTRHAKSGTATTTTSSTYMEGPAVFGCVSPNTCNKPQYEYDGNNNQTTYAWNTDGTLSSVTYPSVVDAGVTVGTPMTSYTYLAYGLVQQKQERVRQSPSIVNLVTRYNYNTSAKYVLSSQVVDYGGLALTTQYVFDLGGTGPGNVTSITDPNGNVTGYKYDNLRRLAEIDAPLGATTLYTYDLDGQPTSTQRADSSRGSGVYQTEVKYYYPNGNLAYVVHPDANPTAPAQGASTTVTSVPCPSSYVTCYTYDADDRALVTTEPLTATTNRVTASAYDLAGERLCTWRGFGTTASALAQVTAGSTACSWTPSSYSSAAALRYDFLAYSANGKVINSTDSDGNLTTLVYDGFDRLSQMILPGTTLGQAAPCHATYTAGDNCEQYGYDNNDNRTSKNNRDGKAITYSFDAMNREYQRLIPANPNSHFSRTLTEIYDLLGRKSQATADSQTLTFNFDTAGRLSSVVDSILGTVGYQHDAADNRTQVTWPDSYFATYAYDALNRVCKVKESATTTCAASDPISSLVAQYTWDTLSRRQALSFGNGVTTGWGYFNDGAASGMTHTIGTKSVGFTYTRNQVNQLATQTVSITDPTNVLKPESFILQPSSASSTAYVPNNLNQYGSVAGVTNAFDLNGNLTSDGTYAYEYDEENRLRSATGAGSTVTYDYDPLGRRRAKTVNGTMTRFLSDDQQEIGEYNNNSTPALLRRYLNGSSIDEHLVQVEAAGTHYYFQTNHQGTTLLSSDTSSPVVLTSFNYGAYGESSSPTTGAAFRYAGRRLDPETGLYYYRARYYSPALGRFLQTDPIGSKDDLNLYAYAGNDPLDRTDPSGNFAFLIPLAVACVESGACEVAAVWAVRVLGAIAVGAIVENAYNESQSAAPAPSSSSPGEHSTPATPPDPDKEPHGNSTSSTKEQHRYEIRDKNTGDVKKTGISGQKLNANGTSPRANSQVNAANRAAGSDTYEPSVEETGIPNRGEALKAEQNATNRLNQEGHSLEWQQRPQPAPKDTPQNE